MICFPMASRFDTFPTVASAAEAAAAELVRVSHWGASSYVSLPLFMPSGSAATVRISVSEHGFRVDDGGFAFREIEAIGADRSFPRTAARIASYEGLQTDRRLIFTYATADQLVRAIGDVGAASFAVVDEIYRRVGDEGVVEIEGYLQERLATIFRGMRIEPDEEIRGASAHPWTVSAAIHMDSGLVVFQAVGNHAYSIYKASTAFHDLNELPTPPRCVAVVKDKNALGVNLNVLAQACRVIQGDQADEVYRSAAA